MRYTIIPIIPALTWTWLGLTTTLVEASPLAHQTPTTTPLTKKEVSISSTPSPPKSQEFSLAMTVDGTNVSLTATSPGGSNDDTVLQAGRLSAFPGTPTYTNQTSTSTSQAGYNTSLVFDLTDSTATGIPSGVYGLSVPDLGSVYGASVNVFAVADYQQFDFDIVDGEIFHQLTAASQHFFACNDTVNGEANYYLKWGVYNENLTPPTGCVFTRVFQIFNIPGGATS